MIKLYTPDNRFIGSVLETPKFFTGIIINYLYSRIYFSNGKLHRLDGPAYINTNGTKYWFFGGKRHRVDGPAWEWNNGIKEWWIDNKRVTEEQCKLLCDMMRLKGIVT